MPQTITERVHALVFNGLSRGLLNHGPFVALSDRERIAKAIVDELRAGNIEFRLGGLALPAEAVTGKVCCGLHGRNCEAPAELCCAWCTEATHYGIAPHANGSRCVLAEPVAGQDARPAGATEA